jgi:nitrous oxide reductase accessory protein NosL
MRRINILFTLICMALLMLTVTVVFAAEPRPDCRICGMWIDQNLHTRHVLTLEDGSRVMFCSLTCAAKYLKTHKAGIKRMQVADFLSAELIDTAQAVYLVDSDAPPVMSNTSIIAFSSRELAEKFQSKHGGKFMTFDQVLLLE